MKRPNIIKDCSDIEKFKHQISKRSTHKQFIYTPEISKDTTVLFSVINYALYGQDNKSNKYQAGHINNYIYLSVYLK